VPASGEAGSLYGRQISRRLRRLIFGAGVAASGVFLAQFAVGEALSTQAATIMPDAARQGGSAAAVSKNARCRPTVESGHVMRQWRIPR
jgi:hypothetical protein